MNLRTIHGVAAWAVVAAIVVSRSSWPGLAIPQLGGNGVVRDAPSTSAT